LVGCLGARKAFESSPSPEHGGNAQDPNIGSIKIDAKTAEELQEELEVEALQEAISESRGERGTVGTREEWQSTDHLNKKYDPFVRARRN
jgi:hypothetical protein